MGAPLRIETATDPESVAKQAGLTYVDSSATGCGRRRRGQGFSYYDSDGRPLPPGERARIDALVIPPAWTDVWVCPNPDGHIQATGRDDKGRKQYVYHEAFREARDRLKYLRMIPFGNQLPYLRRKVGRDLRLEGIPFDRVAGAAVRVLDVAAIRVGNDRYAVSNGSFGLTTLRSRHLEDQGRDVVFRFDSKGGRKSRVTVGDTSLIEVLRELENVPGYRIFKYTDEDGQKRDLTSEDVNEYLGLAIGDSFTAKDFRTWAGNARTVDGLIKHKIPKSNELRRERVRQVVAEVAEFLRNTPSVARSAYVDPRLLLRYEEGDFPDLKRKALSRAADLAAPGRRKRERTLLAVLEALD